MNADGDTKTQHRNKAVTLLEQHAVSKLKWYYLQTLLNTADVRREKQNAMVHQNNIISPLNVYNDAKPQKYQGKFPNT